MAQVPVFPEELLQGIFANLGSSVWLGYPPEYGPDRQTLMAICLANKQCYRLAQPILFSKIYIDDDNIGVIGKLLQAIIDEPRLVTLVSALHIGSWGGFGQDTPPRAGVLLGGTTSPNLGLSPALADARLTLGELAEPLLVDTEQGLEDASLALLLILCQKLTHLHLTVPGDFSTSWVFRALRHVARTNQRALPLLKELTIDHWDEVLACDADEISHMLALPSLRVFKGHTLDFSKNWPTDQYPAMPVNAVSEIQLKHARIDAYGIKRMLLSSPCIERLCIEWEDDSTEDVEFRYDEVGDSLRECHRRGKLDNLRSLTLADQDTHNAARDELEGAVFPPLGDLRSLSALQVLDVPQAALVGADLDVDAYPDESVYRMPSLVEVLPGSLTRLKINSFESVGWEDFDERLLELAVSDNFKHLVEVTMVREEPFSKQEDFEAAGWRLSKKAIPLPRNEELVMTLSRASNDRASDI